MSWLATKYAWKCRHTCVKGSVRLVLLAIALRVKKNYISTVPTALTTLQRLTFLSDDAVRRCLGVLEAVGEVQRVRRGKRAVYAMAKMAGPLFVETPQDAAFFEAEETPQDAGFSNRKMRENAAPAAAGHYSSESVRTEVLSTSTTEEPAAVVLIAKTHEFLEWWATTYSVYSDGAQTTVDLEVDGPLVMALLERRSVERLKAMASVLWLVDKEEPWIAGSDRSLRVLRHKADWLDRRVSGIPDWWIACPHAPKCNQQHACNRQEATG